MGITYDNGTGKYNEIGELLIENRIKSRSTICIRTEAREYLRLCDSILYK